MIKMFERFKVVATFKATSKEAITQVTGYTYIIDGKEFEAETADELPTGLVKALNELFAPFGLEFATRLSYVRTLEGFVNLISINYEVDDDDDIVIDPCDEDVANYTILERVIKIRLLYKEMAEQVNFKTGNIIETIEII